MRFYVLENVLRSRHDVEIVPVEPHYGAPPGCPECQRPVGMRVWLPPHRAELILHGESFGDVAFGAGADPVLSRRVVALGQTHELNGLGRTSPVELVSVRALKESLPAPDYCFVSIGTGPARIDEARSRISREKPIACPVCHHGGLITLVQGFAIAEDGSDGTDLFHVLGLPGVTVVSERFREVVAEAGLLGIDLRPVQEYVWDPYRESGSAAPRPLSLLN